MYFNSLFHPVSNLDVVVFLGHWILLVLKDVVAPEAVAIFVEFHHRIARPCSRLGIGKGLEWNY